MEISSRTRANGCLTISIAGRLDHSSAAALDAALAAHVHDSKTTGIVIDLSNMDYVSSAGMRVSMLFQKGVRANQKEAVLASPRPVVAEIFHISRFDVVYKVFGSREEAEAAIDANLRK